MTTVGAADSCHVVVRTVRVTGIFSVVVLCNDIVVVLRLWHIEASLAVGNPNTKFAAAESTEHHAVVAWDVECQELALKLLGVVVAKVGLVFVVRIDEVELCHELATVADAEREGVLTGIELVECLFCLGIV